MRTRAPPPRTDGHHVPSRSIQVNPADSENYVTMVELTFVFSMIWSVCASVDEEGRKKIDSYLREIEGSFPNKVRAPRAGRPVPPGSPAPTRFPGARLCRGFTHAAPLHPPAFTRWAGRTPVRARASQRRLWWPQTRSLLRTRCTSTLWTPRCEAGRHLKRSSPRAGVTPRSEAGVAGALGAVVGGRHAQRAGASRSEPQREGPTPVGGRSGVLGHGKQGAPSPGPSGGRAADV